jgi:hypothetical protein
MLGRSDAAALALSLLAPLFFLQYLRPTVQTAVCRKGLFERLI